MNSNTQIPFVVLSAQLHLLSTSQGGRKTPIGTGGVYRPQFRLGSGEASCRIDRFDRESFGPGDTGRVEMTLLHPERFGGSLRTGARFEIFEGFRSVGWGVIEQVG